MFKRTRQSRQPKQNHNYNQNRYNVINNSIKRSMIGSPIRSPIRSTIQSSMRSTTIEHVAQMMKRKRSESNLPSLRKSRSTKSTLNLRSTWDTSLNGSFQLEYDSKMEDLIQEELSNEKNSLLKISDNNNNNNNNDNNINYNLNRKIKYYKFNYDSTDNNYTNVQTMHNYGLHNNVFSTIYYYRRLSNTFDPVVVSDRDLVNRYNIDYNILEIYFRDNLKNHNYGYNAQGVMGRNIKYAMKNNPIETMKILDYHMLESVKCDICFKIDCCTETCHDNWCKEVYKECELTLQCVKIADVTFRKIVDKKKKKIKRLTTRPNIDEEEKRIKRLINRFKKYRKLLDIKHKDRFTYDEYRYNIRILIELYRYVIKGLLMFMKANCMANISSDNNYTMSKNVTFGGTIVKYY